MSLEVLFCDVDDFCQTFLTRWYTPQLTHRERKRLQAARLSISEIMSLLIHLLAIRTLFGTWWAQIGIPTRRAPTRAVPTAEPLSNVHVMWW